MTPTELTPQARRTIIAALECYGDQADLKSADPGEDQAAQRHLARFARNIAALIDDHPTITLS